MIIHDHELFLTDNSVYWHYREYESQMSNVRKRLHDTEGEVERMKAKMRKAANLETVVPAIVNRVERTERKLANVSDNQGFRPHLLRQFENADTTDFIISS